MELPICPLRLAEGKPMLQNSWPAQTMRVPEMSKHPKACEAFVTRHGGVKTALQVHWKSRATVGHAQTFLPTFSAKIWLKERQTCKTHGRPGSELSAGYARDWTRNPGGNEEMGPSSQNEQRRPSNLACANYIRIGDPDTTRGKVARPATNIFSLS